MLIIFNQNLDSYEEHFYNDFSDLRVLEPALKTFEDNLLPNLKGKIHLTVSTHKDNNLSLLGAKPLVEENFMIDKKNDKAII